MTSKGLLGGVYRELDRSCISSHLNRRKVRPQGSACSITSIACWMAFSRSGVINGGRYGINTATGLFRLVIRISSPQRAPGCARSLEQKRHH
jgi:hypothetical protein